MVFVLLCHRLDNIHVKGDFILFAKAIESSWVFCRKTSQYYFDWTPVFDVLAKITKTFFGFSAKFKVVLMVFVAVCHTLVNDHVKGNFILFAMSIKVMAILWGKTLQKYFDWTPVFAVLAKNNKFFLIVSVKFKVVLMVFVAVCHTLDNDHVKGNFIFFALSIKVMVISWGKTSQKYFGWTPTFAVLAKKQ